MDRMFSAYGQMDASVQEAIQDLITALVRSLGSTHGKLLTLMRTCPPGAESLALRVLTIFTENGRPSTQLVALVKALINERNLDARFLIPIIAEMDKVLMFFIYGSRVIDFTSSPPLLVGYFTASATHCFYSQRSSRTKEFSSIGFQFRRYNATPNLW